MTIEQFMSHINRALISKTGSPHGRKAKTIFGVCIKYLKDFPDETANVAEEFDLLPRDMKPAQYVSCMRIIIQERLHAAAKKTKPNTSIIKMLEDLGFGI